MFSIDECHIADDHDEVISDKTAMATIANNLPLERSSMIDAFLDRLSTAARVFYVLPTVVAKQSRRTLAGSEPMAFSSRS